MDFGKIKLILNTLKHLKPIQVFYRLYYFFRNKILNLKIVQKPVPLIESINWISKLNSSSCYLDKNNSFTFLNITHPFVDKINWNFDEYGKLWTYNLNYFDFLNQKVISKDIGIRLIIDYIENDKILKDGKEPYPTSLRGINWVKFLAENSIKDTSIDKILYHHYKTLLNNLEYHLLGNHLLENAFSLLFGAYYFKDEKLYEKSKKILISELNEQILDDGAHYELSPMYHQIILSRLLDSVQLINLNSTWKKNHLISFLKDKASLMISWLLNISYNNGNIPMVNDATFEIAPGSRELFSYAEYLEVKSQDIPLSDSGYRKISSKNYELFIDVGKVGPDYQPGHAHSDTFNFELVKDGNCVIVDTGISTYEKNHIRQDQRSTHSHNTVKIGSRDQTQVWGGFRVANRAKITHLKEKPNSIEASHDGYIRDGFKHTRIFSWEKKYILLEDKINKSTNNNARAFFHFHSSVKKPLVDGNNIVLKSLGIVIEFKGASNISLESYQLSEGFNKTTLAYKVIIVFDQSLKTTISL